LPTTPRLGRCLLILCAIWLTAAGRRSPLSAQQTVPQANPPAPAPGTGGRITGRVLDAATGRPISQARVTVLGTTSTAETDLDGRYRTAEVAAGSHSIRVIMIGFRPEQRDSVKVTSGQATVVNVALSAAPIQIADVEVVAQIAPAPASDAGLLAMQKAAPSASDGISAEAMSRTPDTDAGAAIARVTGVSVVDDKFVVVRGLGERYNSTLLNGSELPSPEPMKRTVPLDVFPAALLESIVTAKSATPDMPGDFAGGSVQIQTKEFPENFVGQIWASGSYNSEATFQPAVIGPRSASDLIGKDNGSRQEPANPPTVEDNTTNPSKLEAFGEGLRDVWTPTPTDAPPSVGFGFNFGGQFGAGKKDPVGVVASVTYNSNLDQVNNRQFAFVSDTANGTPDKQLTFNETHSIVDLGGIFNLAAKLGASHQLAWKNFYTQNAEEVFYNSTGYDLESNLDQVQDYQVLYVERTLLQTQLSGADHLRPVWNSRFDWKLTGAWATRNEPENRQARYGRKGNAPFSLSSARSNYDWFRYLQDQIGSAQADWAVPVSVRAAFDGQLKVGGLYRKRSRQFDSQSFVFRPVTNTVPDSYDTLPPEQAWAPENIGSNMKVYRLNGRSQPYESKDDVTAFYAMEDLPVLSRVRLAGGVRYEVWSVKLFPGSEAAPTGVPTYLKTEDWLWSANATVTLNPKMQLRLAAFRSVARPDPRELSPDDYTAVGGECSTQGNPNLKPTNILNIDARWELYPQAGELVAVSPIYKYFDQPILEVLDAPGSGACRVSYANATSATNYGAEFEARKSLGFIGGGFRGFSAGLNALVVRSRVTLDTLTFGQINQQLSLAGQSPYLFNANLNYSSARAGVTASVLLNYFADRIVRYGITNTTSTGSNKIPDAIEQGRFTLDAKVAKGLGRWTLTLAGKNLTNSTSTVTQYSAAGDVPILVLGTGIDIKLGVGYDF
jgi:outer membrane receptor protein involved in Fe transport